MNIFVDVGAGRGEIFTLDDVVPPEQRKATELVCIEPSPRNFVHLMDAAERHAGEWRGVALFSVAISDATGCEQLYLKTDHSGDSLKRKWAVNDVSKVPIAVGTLNVVTALNTITNGFQPYHQITLKLDCEGSESAILAALLDEPLFLALEPRILVEWHDADPDCRQYLERTYRQRGIELELWNH